MTDVFKLLLIGNSSAGKSSLLLRYTNDVWEPEDSQATIGVDFKSKSVTVQGRKIKLTIWDTAGQERFRTLTSSYYRGCQGVLVVFDVSNRASFDQLPKWFAELDSHLAHGGGGGGGEVVTFVVANKTDRPGRMVSVEEGEGMARKVGAAGYFEVSAKDGTGVQHLFAALTEQVLAQVDKVKRDDRQAGIDLAGPMENDHSSCAC